MNEPDSIQDKFFKTKETTAHIQDRRGRLWCCYLASEPQDLGCRSIFGSQSLTAEIETGFE